MTVVTGTALRERPRNWAAGRYALAWFLAIGAVVAFAVGLLHVPSRHADPVAAAARHGGCVLRQDAGDVAARDLDVMQPPTFGPRARPAAPGVYTHAPHTAALVGALRRGVVVIQYRPGTTRQTVADLQAAHDSVPVILTPDRTGMRYAVAATAWGRLLGCPDASSNALQAVRLFALRFRGSGPDAKR